jgi:drug/metabolite transporter (DMT)-like permease
MSSVLPPSPRSSPPVDHTRLARQALLILLAACACWGISFPLGKALLLAQADLGAPSWGLVAWSLTLRFLLAAVVIGWWCRRELTKPSSGEWAQGIGLGIFTAGGMLLQSDALTRIEASTVAFLTQGSVVWVPLILVMLTRRLPSLRIGACCVVVLIGVGILAQVDLRRVHLGFGELQAIGCSLLFSGQILWAERPRYAANRMGLVAIISFIVSAAIYAPVAVAGISLDQAIAAYADPWRIAVLVVLGAICTGLGMLLMFRWQRFIGATAAALIYCTEPIWASLFAFVLPALLAVPLAISYANEGFTTHLLIGGTLIIAANVAMQWRRAPAAS